MLKTEDLSELEEMDIFEKTVRRGKTFTRKELAYLRMQRLLRNPRVWQGRWSPAFWTVSGIVSLIFNIILIALLLGLARELFTLKRLVSEQLIGGLASNFSAMENAVIETTVAVDETITVNDVILVSDSIPVVFDLELNQQTGVKITADTAIYGAVVNITTPNLQIINAPADIVLPKGTVLPTRLNLTVPVSQTVPIELSVPIRLDVPVQLEIPVSIPLKDTDLQAPFAGLQDVVSPYQVLLAQSPNSWEEAACEAGKLLCWLFGE